jgi:hypothetical protein
MDTPGSAFTRLLSIGAACWLLAALGTPCASAASDLTLTTDDLLGGIGSLIVHRLRARRRI